MSKRGPDLGEQVTQLRHLTEQAEAEAGRLQDTLERIASLTREIRRGQRQLEGAGEPLSSPPPAQFEPASPGAAPRHG